MWDTLKWFSKKFGLLAIDEIFRLTEKKKALSETLVSTVHRPMRKATVPSKAFVVQVEETAARPPSGSESRIHSMDSFICGIVRFQLGTSARFSDLQHTNPDTLKVTSTTVELAAWQTKTHSAVVVKKKPAPLICPKYSFSGKDWWTPLLTTWRKLAATPMFEGMDYLIPTVGKDYDGFIARPASSERALNWLRAAMARQELQKDFWVDLTWHSFRVFMPDCAFQAQICRDQRQYLGNWMAESTADVYAREKRNVVCAIWNKVTSNLDAIDTAGSRTMRIDLSHEEQPEAQEGPMASAPPLPAAATPHKAPKASSPSPRHADSPASSWLLTPIPADEVPPPQSPLQPVSATLVRGNKRKIHLLNQDLRAVGCGWCPSMEKV